MEQPLLTNASFEGWTLIIQEFTLIAGVGRSGLFLCMSELFSVTFY